MQGVCFNLGANSNFAFNNEVSKYKQGITILSDNSGNIVHGNRVHHCTGGMEITFFTKNGPARDNLISEKRLSRNNIGIILSISFQDSLCFTYNNTLENNLFLSNIIGV
jgi:hypothetical protein